MKEVKVKVIEEFRDRTEDLKVRKVNSEFFVDEERAKLLVGRELVEIVKEEEHDGKTEDGAKEKMETPAENTAEEKPAKGNKEK